MLSRKTSDILFYGIIIGIIGIIFLIRFMLLSSLDNRISQVENQNQILQMQITNVRTIVEDNKNQQLNNIYQMYEQIPAEYSRDSLNFYVLAKLEQVGVSEDLIMTRKVSINENKTFESTSDFREINTYFKIVEVNVTFSTTDINNIIDFIDEIYESEQLFIIDSLEYSAPADEFSSIPVTISFLAFYELEVESTS
ncbi:hypothetical protein CI105_03125 [Candidatus Izimaplasma bacterium ZiA1]|uniref:hypothetical protein n=1 Tax=Candidatus Izimoplasma sp. ZiA1 TaxID=2024899 RepID=UPI000BAA735E|nr:hypothetical protein CI105_03125 [Candidatus Izimaplasma bacterium ZiA1]